MGFMTINVDMNLDLKELKKELQEKKGTERGRYSIYVSGPIWEEFKKACHPESASAVLELFMRKTLEARRK